MKMGFWQVGWVGNNSWMDSAFVATSGPTKRRKHYLCLLFSPYCVCYFLNISRNPNLCTSPKNQFQDYHAWNRIEKLMPQLWNCSPQTFKTLQKTANLFSNLDFLPKSEFPKTLDLSMDFPRIFHGFPTPWPGSLGRALQAGLSRWVFAGRLRPTLQ